MTYRLLPLAERSEAQMSRAIGTVDMSDLLLDSCFQPYTHGCPYEGDVRDGVDDRQAGGFLLLRLTAGG